MALLPRLAVLLALTLPVLAGVSAPAHPAAAQSLPQPSYRAPWIAEPNAEPLAITVAEKQWAPTLWFRPVRTLVLAGPAVERGKRGARLEAGTLMVAMDEAARIACQLERPKGRYFIGCVEDHDGDGRYDSLFLLNHANPFLFSAMRQPRHKKAWAIEPVTLRAAEEAQVPRVAMVFFYKNRAELSGTSQFQLCVLRQQGNNMWGDETAARGCLPAIAMKDGASPIGLDLYGRRFTIAAPVNGATTVSISAQSRAVQVQL